MLCYSEQSLSLTTMGGIKVCSETAAHHICLTTVVLEDVLLQAQSQKSMWVCSSLSCDSLILQECLSTTVMVCSRQTCVDDFLSNTLGTVTPV